MEKHEGTIIGVIFVCLGLLIVVHHFLVSGRLFDLADMLHHEFFEAILLTAGIVLLLTYRQNSK